MAENYPTFTPWELQNEFWKPVPNYEGIYSVSNLGRVRRDRGGYLVCQTGRILKPGLRSGYPSVTLCKRGKRASTTIHRLVALAFIGPKPIYAESRAEINHLDGDRKNNRLSNLEYATVSENKRHAVRIGLGATGDRNGSRKHPERLRRGDRHPARQRPEYLRRGGNHHRAKLTEEIVRQIRAEYIPGVRGRGCRVLARKYGLHYSTVEAILRKETWTHSA